MFVGLELGTRDGLVVLASADAPPGRFARDERPGARRRFWEESRRMPQGGLVAVMTKHKCGNATVAVATLTMSEVIK